MDTLSAIKDLTVCYHASARSELISRVERRDAVIFLYLGSSSTVLGIVLSDVHRLASLLFLVPMLGVGAALLFDLHNTVIGALCVYIAKELPAPLAAKISPERPPRSWEDSDTLASMRGHVGMRFGSSVVLLAGPGFVALALAAIQVRSAAINLPSCVASFVMLMASVGILTRSHLRRTRLRKLRR